MTGIMRAGTRGSEPPKFDVGKVRSQMTALREAWHEVDGRTLRYLTGGTGPPCVLCHGFLGSAENFAAWFATMTKHRTLVIPDLPGSGSSDTLPEPHTARALALAVQQLIDHLRLARFDVGGLCLGSGVAFEVALNNRGHVNSLILHTPLLRPSLTRRRFHAQVATMTAPGMWQTVAYLGHKRWVSDLYKRLVVEGGDVAPEPAEANFLNQLRADPRAQREWLRDGLRRDDIEQLTQFENRSLVIVADDDRIVDVPGLRQAVNSMDHVVLACIEAAGHGWNEHFVEAQCQALDAFFRGAPQDPSP
jgi:pimeloyl-ACP methyl ester carboxylesterase